MHFPQRHLLAQPCKNPSLNLTAHQFSFTRAAAAKSRAAAEVAVVVAAAPPAASTFSP